MIGNWYGYPDPGFAGAIYSPQGIAPTIRAQGVGYNMPLILLEHPIPIADPNHPKNPNTQ